MVAPLERVHSRRANPREFTASEINEPTLQSADQWYELFGEQADNTTTFGAGHGVNNEKRNSDGWSDLDVQSTPDGGTTINATEGRVRFRVYRDSSKDELVAQSGTYTLNSLRSAVAAGRKDKALIPGMLSVVPRTDGYLTVEIKPDPSSVGETISKSDCDSDQGLAYSELSF